MKKKGRAVKLCLFCFQWRDQLYITLDDVKLHPESLRSDPNYFTIGPNGDFKIWEKKALENVFVHRSHLSTPDKGTAKANIFHFTFVRPVIENVLSDNGTRHAGIFPLVCFIPSI